jgi:hypothetical protein
MLTVKLIRINGEEQISEAAYVVAEPNGIEHQHTVFAHCPGVPPQKYVDDGHVYVMNEAGQTVAKYWLGGIAGIAPRHAPSKAA